MEFVGKALIEITIECDSEAIAQRKFEKDMRVSNFGVQKSVIVEPLFVKREEVEVE